MQINSPGIYPDFPIDAYFADPCPAPSLTQSVAKVIIERSPLHAWSLHPRLGGKVREDDYDSAKAIGNAAHKLFLERGKDVVVLDFPDFRKGEARTARDLVVAEGKVPILDKHHKRATWMVKRAREHLQCFGLSEFASDTEVVLAWKDGDIWCRTMIDKLSTTRGLVVDFKTTGMCCSPTALPRMMVDMGWDVQAAMHDRGLNVLHPESTGRRRHLFVVQENEEPYAITVAQMSRDTLTMGHKKLQTAVDLWAASIVTQVWPGYPTEVVVPEYPGYAEQQWLDREIRDAARQRLANDLIMAG